MENSVLKQYARLIAAVGANVQPGQEVVIRSEPEQMEFLEMLTEQCYLAGASKVTVEWRSQVLQKLDIKYQSDEVLGRVEPSRCMRRKTKKRSDL